MTIVISRPDNAVSAVKLGYPVVRSLFGNSDGGPFINWGCSTVNGPAAEGARQWLNKPIDVSKTVNKGEYIKRLTNVEGINVPQIVNSGELLPIGKWICRYNQHAEGSELSLETSSGNRRIWPGDHALKFIEPTREYRLWFFQNGGDVTFLTAKRVPRAIQGQDENDVCRSKWGYQWCEGFAGAEEMATKALEIVPLNFGAFDMLWAYHERKWYILEVNTAPSLDHRNVLEFFKPKIDSWVAANAVAVTPAAPRAIVAPVAAPPAVIPPPQRDGNTIRIRRENGRWIEIDLSGVS